eukprot:GHVR01041144.1.p1 GENE.GHVR01041144.1~~GHVR01041144.1.p1  ORF type:complete len:145 (+),score=2.36 GHVR01041144.1:68-502(+)
MYLVSKNSIVYDLILNHGIYHSFLCFALLGYSYVIRKIDDYVENSNKEESKKTSTKTNKNFLEICKDQGFNLLKMRILVASVSVLSELLISHFSINKKGVKLQMPEHSKRILLFKELFLQTSWFSYVLLAFNTSYQNDSTEETI